MFNKLKARLKKRAINKVVSVVKKTPATPIVSEDKDLKQVLISLAITILERLGKEYLKDVQANIEKDGFQIDDLLGSLKKGKK